MRTRLQAAFPAAVALSIAAIFLCVRARWVGHLLTWDETMNLCTVRAFVTHSRDTFANWFWRHPPLFCLAMTQLRPLAAGFAERTEWLAIGCGLVNAALLYRLNRRVFDTATAAWSAFCFAVLPAAIFFGVWVKRDHTAATFGLLALLLLSHHRLLWAGLALALAFLSKETALFFAGSIAICLIIRRAPWRNWLALFGPAVAGSAWWYVLFSTDRHVSFATGQDTGWVKGVAFYFANLPRDLGWPGLALALCGAGCLVTCRRAHPADRMTWWPLAMLIPAYGLLTALPSKVPWVPAVCTPAWATLCALAIARIARPGVPWRYAMQALLAVALLLTAARLEYDAMLLDVSADHWRGAHYSHEIAETANTRLGPKDRLLLTSFHHWKGVPPGHPCPIFAYYFTRQTPVLLRPHDRPFAAYLHDIRANGLTRAIVSPIPGVNERDVFDGFIREHGLDPVRMQRAFLFNTTPLLEHDAGRQP